MSKESMKNSGFLNALEFFKEDREVKALLRQGSDAIFKGVTLGILQNPREKRNTSSKVSRISHDFSEVLGVSQKKVVPSYDVVNHIETVVDRVHDVIGDKGLLTQEGKTHIKETIRLRAFIFWVLDVLRKSGFHVSKKKYKGKLQDVPSKYSMVLYDILKDKALSTLLIVLKSYGFVNLSDNQINDYEVEEEVKVLNINKKEVVSKLEGMGAEKVFEGEVHDVYYDYPDGIEKLENSGGIKSTFRIRSKTDKSGSIKYYYTVKRKLTKEEEEELVKTGVLEAQGDIKTRRCYEKEFEIKNIDLFKRIIDSYGLVFSREKRKQRVSYSLENGNIKFDFDDYKGKKEMMEIEASKYSYIPQYIEVLGLQNHKTSTSGSRKFLTDEYTDENTD